MTSPLHTHAYKVRQIGDTLHRFLAEGPPDDARQREALLELVDQADDQLVTLRERLEDQTDDP